MCDWVTYTPSGGEEEEVDMRIDLRDDGEVDVKVQIECFKWDIGAQGAIFPLVTKGVR